MNSITCSELDRLIDLHLDDSLPEDLRGDIERHLMTCEACAFKTRSFEQIRELLGQSFPLEEAAPGFRDRLSARLLAEFDDILVRPSESLPNQLELPYLRISAR